MSTPLALIAQGTFTSTGAARAVQLPKAPHYFMVRNRSTWGTTPGTVIQSEWWDGFGAGAAQTITDAAGAMTNTVIAAGGAGFTFFDSTLQTPGALVATGTAINQANPAIVTDATSPPLGSIVRMLNTTAMLQIAGMDFTVTAVNAGVNFTLGYLNSAGFGAAATNADYRIIPAPYYSPYRRWITGITTANPGVITVSVAHNYLVGDKITLHIPAAYGTMSALDGRVATITAVGAATMTIDIDTSAYAFAFPTSAVAAAGVSFACVTNTGEIATKLTSAQRNAGYYAMYLDTAVVGANTDVMDWIAFSRDVTY